MVSIVDEQRCIVRVLLGYKDRYIDRKRQRDKYSTGVVVAVVVVAVVSISSSSRVAVL